LTRGVQKDYNLIVGIRINIIKNKYKNNQKIKLFSAQKALAIMALFLLFIVPVNGAYAASLSDVNKLDREINRLNNVIKGKKSEAQSLQNELAVIDAEITKIQLEINRTQTKIDTLSAEISKTEKKIKETEIELTRMRDQLSELIRTMYEDGQVSMIEVIAKSGSFSEFVNRSEYIEQVQLKVKETADKVLKLKEELEAKKKN
jgi:peptidoglycan hydrolase CwlO-like protein